MLTPVKRIAGGSSENRGVQEVIQGLLKNSDRQTEVSKKRLKELVTEVLVQN